MKDLNPEFIKPYLSPVELEYVESLEAQIKQLQEAYKPLNRLSKRILSRECNFTGKRGKRNMEAN